MRYQENKDNIKNLYSITNKLLFWKEPLPLPDTDNPEKLAISFSEFFDEKIRKIMHVLAPESPSDINTVYIEKEPLTHRTMTNFSEIEESTMRCIIQKSVTKLCELDPLPTIFFKTTSNSPPATYHQGSKCVHHYRKVPRQP